MTSVSASMTQCSRLIAAFFLILIASSYVGAQSGVILPQGFVVKVNKKITCGLVSEKWIPGSLLKNGSFLSIQAKIVSLKKKLKKKGLSSSQRSKLIKQRDALKKKLKSSAKICAALSSNGIVTPTPAPTIATPLPGAVTVSWSVTALEVKANIGSEYLHFCPPNPSESLRSIWGHDVYTADSAICVAAAHIGLLSRITGGNVKIRIKPGLQIYLGSLRNLIQSNFFGSYDSSFVFIDLASGAEIVTGSIPVIPYTQNAQPIYTYVGQSFTFTCPPASLADIRNIWGTGLYTYDSSICTAAVHAGRISIGSGGIVNILIEPGANSYTGSTSHGITSSSYGAWGGSYRFVS